MGRGRSRKPVGRVAVPAYRIAADSASWGEVRAVLALLEAIVEALGSLSSHPTDGNGLVKRDPATRPTRRRLRVDASSSEGRVPRWPSASCGPAAPGGRRAAP